MVFRAVDVYGDYVGDKRPLEVTYVRGVLGRLGFDLAELQSGDKPDVVAQLLAAGKTCRVGCEVTLLHADQTSTGSPLRRFWGMWFRIAREVHDQLAADQYIVPYCAVRFRNDSYRVDLRDGAGIARDLYLVGRRLSREADVVVGDEYPAIHGIISRVTVVDRDGMGRLWWPSHLQSGGVPSLDEAVRRAFREKCRVAQKYDWAGVERKWLLLVAEGRGTTDIIGKAKPIDVPEEGVVPFDEVVVWDRFSEDIWLLFPSFGVLADAARKVRNIGALPEALRPFAHPGEYATRERRSRPG